MKYRKKPIIIDAWVWDGKDETVNLLMQNGLSQIGMTPVEGTFSIPTLEGDMSGKIGDYIIKGVEGEFYPCKKSVFEKTYEKVENE